MSTMTAPHQLTLADISDVRADERERNESALTSDAQMREWLPKLASVERSVPLVLSNGDRVRGSIDEQHEQGLTRDEVTAAVHYLRWVLDAEQVEAFRSGPVRIEIDHPAHLESAQPSDVTHAEVLGDLAG